MSIAVTTELPEAGRAVIGRSCPCATCGYDLQTRAVGGGCPECDTPARFTFVHQANRLAGADRRSLRAVTRGVLWLALALLWPVIFVFAPLPAEGRGRSGEWYSGNRTRLAVVIPPALFAAVGCWRLSTRVRPGTVPEDDDQPVTRWALRVMVVLWFAPMMLIAAATPDLPAWSEDVPWYRALEPVIKLGQWLGVPATLLVFRRLAYLARRAPSKHLLAQVALVGSQLPMGVILLAAFAWREYRYESDAFAYAVSRPMPGVGLPWPVVLKADALQWIEWRDFADRIEYLLILWPIVFMAWTLVLLAEFAVMLWRVRRARDELPVYCRELLAARERDREGR